MKGSDCHSSSVVVLLMAAEIEKYEFVSSSAEGQTFMGGNI
jgi:hypothetical protein